MTHLEAELDHLRADIGDMINLIRSQLEKSKEAIKNNNVDLAEEVIATDKRVNGMELKIDLDVENILALYQPVAIDLRLVLASHKINHDLERIGDNMEGIAKYIVKTDGQLQEALVASFNTIEMFDKAAAMIAEVSEAFDNEDSSLARRVFKKDDWLNANNSAATGVAVEHLKKPDVNHEQVLYVLSIIRKLERIGDLAKNLAEEIIFYIDAKVLKHKKKPSS
jgi:phosphate transport system protein